ncbi:37ae79d7-f47b-4e3f-b3a6-05d20da8d1cc [Thermothielavioides terrestris]|uniref:37ae79d7-f47b-4e3f-b3a6-05d20da8d1cc n=1 Tax=Thermothielavioides terrestris TaxID=2587410 RepID=A0A3S4F3U9_9PEZI|nr:37ae79d7-f47b-4e3f-b3a6-05d20da8d1cc [Thermothielavioides terrestris]
MGLASLLQALGPPVQSVEEETFALFAQDLPHEQNLGFVDAKALSLELTVAGRDLTIHQSPAVLSSNRAGGTTGAVLWKITPLFAAWLASPTSNPLFTHGILSATSLVLELGCGISGLAALLLAPHIARYVLTDQAYVARLVERNVAENWAAVVTATAAGKPAKAARRAAVASASSAEDAGGGEGQKIVFTPLDWETDAVTAALAGGGSGGAKTFDVVVACDCVYNEALIEPFVATCVDVCRLRTADDDDEEGGGGDGG